MLRPGTKHCTAPIPHEWHILSGCFFMQSQSSRFYGWTVVAAAFVVAVFGWGVGFYGPPIYLKAVRDTRGWSVALVSAAITVHFLVGAIAVANLPRLYRRFGLAPITAAGAASLAFGVAGWAFAV